jgi:hypothetical protein
VSSPATFDLCQLTDVKAWLAIAANQTTDDSLLSRLITSVSYDFLREIGRLDFTPAQTYTEVREGDGGASMVLRHWPLNQVTSVTVTTPLTSPAMTVIPESTDDVMSGYWIDMDLDPERRWELYLDGYTFTDLAVVTVTYNAGYATVPQDAQQAAIEWTAYRYKTRQWIGQTSKHMAQGETVQTPESEIPPGVKRVIERYRRYDPLQTPPERVPLVGAAAVPARSRR